MKESQEDKKNLEVDEIDLLDLFRKVWAGRDIILKITGVFFIFGIIVILGSPKEYTSSTKLLVESGGKSTGMSSILQQIGGVSGIKSSGEGITPDLYPDIVSSTPFLSEIASQKVNDKNSDSLITVANFIAKYTEMSFSSKLKKYTIGLPRTILDLFKSKKPDEKPIVTVPVVKSKVSYEIAPFLGPAIGELSQHIIVKDDESGNVLVVSAEMQDPIFAAQLTEIVINSLTNYIIEYRTQKARKDLEFIEARCLEARNRYVEAQENLAWCRDQNRNVILASKKTEEERLYSEFNLASSVYLGLAQQLEQSKIKVQESTPVFKVIEPAKIGGQSKPKVVMTMFFTLFLGFAFGGFVVVLKLIISAIKKNL